jgi:hypothetical protein
LAGTPQGLRWADAVAALDAAAGAVLLIAGIYLIEPALIDLGLYVEADRYRLAGFVLVYAGLVFTYAGLFGLSPPADGFVARLVGALFGTLARACVAAMMLTFAVRAAGAGLPVLWIALPAGIGLLALLSVPLALFARSQSVALATDHGITADTGKSEPFVASAYLRTAGTFVVTVSISIFMLGLALIAYVLLDRAFVEGRPISLTVAEAIVGRTLVPLMVKIVQLMVAVVLIAGAAGWLRERARVRDKSGLERDLSAEEVSFAAACVQQIRDYVSSQGLADAARRTWSISVWFVVGLGLLTIWLLWDLEQVLAQAYAPASEAWQLYVIDRAPTGIAAFLAAISLAFVPQAVLKLVSRRAAEASGANMLKAARGAGELEAEIVKRVRDRSLAPGTTFDAGELMRLWGITTAVIVLVWNVLLLGGVAVWWPHERARDTLFTEGQVETGNFWTTERTAHGYADVLAAYPMCDGDGDIGYEIDLPGEVMRALLSERGLLGRLDDLVKIDSKLRAARVPFVFALPGEETATGDVVDRMCVLRLTQEMDEATRAKVEQILHLDEWYERRWRQRTGDQPRVSSS